MIRKLESWKLELGTVAHSLQPWKLNVNCCYLEGECCRCPRLVFWYWHVSPPVMPSDGLSRGMGHHPSSLRQSSIPSGAWNHRLGLVLFWTDSWAILTPPTTIWTWGEASLWVSAFSFFGSISSSVLLDHRVALSLCVWGAAMHFPRQVHHFTFPPALHKASNFPMPPQHFFSVFW